MKKDLATVETAEKTVTKCSAVSDMIKECEERSILIAREKEKIPFLIRSLNVANWAWKINCRNHGARLVDNLAVILNSLGDNEEDSVICIQEIILGKKEKYRLMLETLYPNHKILYSKFYDNNRNYASAITIMLVPQRFTVKVLELPISDPWLRYNYVEISGGGISNPIRVLNLHLPHLNLKDAAGWYKYRRAGEREAYLEAIGRVIEECNEKEIPLAIAGDFNTLDTDKEFIRLTEQYHMFDVMPDEEKVKPTFNNPIYGAVTRIDYILVNPALHKNMDLKAARVDDMPHNIMTSDHALLCLDMKVS